MILDEQGAKLSKRTGAADVMQYRDAGYLPHALLNYLVRLGWSHGDQEVFSHRGDAVAVRPRATSTPRRRGWTWPSSAGSTSSTSRRTIPRRWPSILTGTCEQAGYDLAKGPKPADLVVALRERAQTLKEMAEKCGGVVPAADRRTTKRRWPSTSSRSRARAAGAMRERGWPRWRTGRRSRSTMSLQGSRRGARHRHGQDRAAAAGGDHRHAGQPGHRLDRVSVRPRGSAGPDRRGPCPHRLSTGGGAPRRARGSGGLSCGIPARIIRAWAIRMRAPIPTITSTTPTPSWPRWSAPAASADCA